MFVTPEDKSLAFILTAFFFTFWRRLCQRLETKVGVEEKEEISVPSFFSLPFL